MAVHTHRLDDRRNSRRRSGSLLQHQCKTIPKDSAAPARPRLRRADLRDLRSADARAGQPAVAVRSRAARRHGVRLDSAGRSGHRTFGRRLVRAEPDLLRSRKHRQAGDRRRVQRRGVDARRARDRWRGSTRTRFRSWSSSITTSSSPTRTRTIRFSSRA